MLTAIIVGAGNRSLIYASYAQSRPDELRIVGVAEPDPVRRAVAAALYDLPPDRCFASAAALAGVPRFADCVINGTMDAEHVPTALPLLAAGYDMLLEKPFALNERELWQLADAVRHYGRKVVICHVLRHAPFYAAIREQVFAGAVGDILNIQMAEHVSYHHMIVGYVRGKWNSLARCGSTMLMAKCCHDLDILTWMKGGVPPVKVASFGSNYQFRPDKAPPGAGARCVVDCAIEPQCPHSARKHYIDHPDWWSQYVWDESFRPTSLSPTVASVDGWELPVPRPDVWTLEEKIESLAANNPYGRCVWHCDNDVVDHQSVVVEFADGATGTLNMVGGAAMPSRRIHIIGTLGEIEGTLEDSRFCVRTIDPGSTTGYRVDTVDLTASGDVAGHVDAHGNGDQRLVADFVRILRGEPHSLSTTLLDDSIAGHLLGFAADRARTATTVELLPNLHVTLGAHAYLSG